MNERDIRVRIDLTFDPTDKVKADQLRDLIKPFLESAVLINGELANEERGYLDIERCGHRIGVACSKLERWELGRGKVIDNIQPIELMGDIRE